MKIRKSRVYNRAYSNSLYKKVYLEYFTKKLGNIYKIFGENMVLFSAKLVPEARIDFPPYVTCKFLGCRGDVYTYSYSFDEFENVIVLVSEKL